MTGRCGARYGRGLVCKRLLGHRGNHAIRPTVAELTKILLERQN